MAEMIHIELNDEDAGVLTAVLESYLSDLRMEIADTDRLAFREMLKDRKAALHRILKSLRDRQVRRISV